MSSAPDLPRDLLGLAREDLVAAEALDRAERVSDAPVGFHAQQAVEKALKAAVASRDRRWLRATCRSCRSRSPHPLCGGCSLRPR
jgi:hypothetical protein